jgi:hypothetical protein
MSDTARTPDFEALLRRALAPVEPPADLAERLETRLTGITELAAAELDAWELDSVRDPRNWPRLGRPAAAVVVGGAAGTALVLLRVRRRAAARRPTSSTAARLAEAAEAALREVFKETRRVGR